MEKREPENIVILAAGNFPTHEVPLKAFRKADFVVCCDGAYGEMKNEDLRMKDYVVIGDGDSLTEEDKRRLGGRYVQVSEQDYNDLHKAMDWATRRFSVPHLQFSILGATGRREDHTLGNIGYLATFAEEHPGIDIRMLTDYGVFQVMRGVRTFDSFPRQQVSFITLDPRTSVTAMGLQWPLHGAHLHRWWQGTLNSALGDTFTLESDGWLIVFQTYEAKP